jgi:hypothetical protein
MRIVYCFKRFFILPKKNPDEKLFFRLEPTKATLFDDIRPWPNRVAGDVHTQAALTAPREQRAHSAKRQARSTGKHLSRKHTKTHTYVHSYNLLLCVLS